jgi:AbrB family looped-hinge helix DNA binding protein
VLAKVFSKGQIVIPAVLRKALGIEIGDKVNIVVEKDGIKITLVKKQATAEELAGVFSKYAKGKPSLTEEEIEKATEKGFIDGLKDEIH